MPTVATSPSRRIHSWSSVYLSTLMGFLLVRVDYWRARLGAFRNSALVVGLDEGQRHDLGRQRLAANDQVEGMAGGGHSGLGIAHSQRTVEARAEAAAGDLADLPAGGVLDFRMLAGRLAALGQDADAPALGALPQLALDDRGPRKATLAPAALADTPGEPGLDGGRGLVDVMAVKAEPGLEPQRIPRAQADGLHLGHPQQAPRQAVCGLAWHRDFESVLSGIAGAGDEATRALDAPEGALHEAQGPASRDQTRECRLRRRALEGEQRARGQVLDHDFGADMGPEMRLVRLLAGGVDHQDQVISGIGHHEIVEDSPGPIGEEGIAHASRGKPGNIGGDDTLQGHRRCRPSGLRREAELAHM